MTAFRRVGIDGPDYGSNDPLWQAWLDLGPQPDATGQPPRNSSIRVILQSVRANPIHVEGQADVFFQEPMLLAMAATTVDLRRSPPSAPFVKIGRAQFTPLAITDLAPLPAVPGAAATPASPSRYSDLRVAPKTAWPPRPQGFVQINHVFELAAPRLRATRGRIAVVCALDIEPKPGTGDSRYALTKLLSVEWATPGDYIRIFGGLFIRRRKTAKPLPGHTKASDAITFDLTPDGIEFEVLAPNPFGTSNSDRLPLRLRLVPIAIRNGLTGLQLDLIDGSQTAAEPAPLTKLKAGLNWMSRDLAERGGCISLQVDTSVIPPLAWPLQIKGEAPAPIWVCDNPAAVPGAELIPSIRLLEDAVAARLLTRADYDGGEAGVAELTGHRTTLAARRGADPVVLTIASQAEQPPPLDDVAATSPTVLLTWSEAAQPPLNPDKMEVGPFSGIVDAAPLAVRFGRVWAASGAIASGTRPPYAFIALERGWVQMPIPPAPKPDDPPPVRLLAAGSAFRGFLRLAIAADRLTERADNPALPGLEIVAAQRVNVTVTWKKPLDTALPRSIVARVDAAAGTLEGVLWAGEASPSPTEILPPLDSGPAALTTVPISFGVSGPTNWQVQVAGFRETGVGSISFKLPLFASVSDPLLVWRPHETLALVSSVSMTRTAECAQRPSTTRELVPAEVIGGLTTPLVLTFAADTDGKTSRLPRIDALPLSTTAFGDGRWRWPWPALQAAGAGPYPSSPEESAGVALASLTLPGIEFAPAADATTPVSSDQMRVSLRYDLPLLDELFANSKAPEPKAPTSAATKSQYRSLDAAPGNSQRTDTPPTALDLARLSGVWFENARRLARARTEADRVVLRELEDQNHKPVVELWHRLSGVTDGVVRGIAEPYVWKPSTFSFSALPPAPNVGVNLGAYRLDKFWQYGPAALAGLPDTNFTIPTTGNELKTAAAPGPGQIKVKGFAASSFPVTFTPPDAATAVTQPNHLQDARGMSLALMPNLASSAYTSRTVALRAAPDDHVLMLATLRKPTKVMIGDIGCDFWFRDLPLKPDADRLTFDTSGGVETGLGPDPSAINRNRVARTLYEWSFFGPQEERSPAAQSSKKQPKRGRFEFDLAGPLSARPLRLLSVDVAPTGGVLQFEMLVSVQYKSPPSDDNDTAPFAAETIYATGNLLRLTFGPGSMPDGSLALTKMVRIEIKDPSDPTMASDPFNPPSKADPKPADRPKPISLGRDVEVYHGPSQIPSQPSKTRLSFDFHFSRNVQNSKPDIALANLRVRLFGQDCNLDTTDAGFNPPGLTASFNAQPESGTLNLKKIQLIWPARSGPTLYLADGDLTVPLRDVDSPAAFKRNFADGTLQWLGLGSRPANGAESIDHENGVVTIDVHDRITGPADGQQPPALFRGFHLPAGTLHGMVAVVFPKRHAVEGQKWPTWPTPPLGSALVELAFDADVPTSPQRITAIRHRHTGAAAVDGNPVSWRSRLLFDAAFAAPGLDTSSVLWPVGYATPSRVTFDPDSSVPADWPTTLTMRGSGDPLTKLMLAHKVQPRLCAHELPTDILVADGDAVVLGSSWSFRAVVDHTLTPIKGGWPDAPAARAQDPLTWTSIDEVIMFDMHRLIASANLPPDPARDRYAFLARFKDAAPDADVRIAGVVRRALADAGFPIEYVMQALRGTVAPDSLILTGAALTEVVTSLETPNQGVILVPQWILPWAPLSGSPSGDANGAAALGILKSCPQTHNDNGDSVYNIALYDATAGTPRSLEGAPPCSLAVQDGTQSLLEAQMSSIVGGGKARTNVAVDQSMLVPKTAAVPPLSRPLFARTLLALNAVARAYGKALSSNPMSSFARRISCVTAREIPLEGDHTAGEVRFIVTAWPPNAPPLDFPAPAVTLTVTDAVSVYNEILPAALAATLVDSTSNQVVLDGKQRADASMRAFGLSANPRVSVLASVDSSYLTIHDPQSSRGPDSRSQIPPPHISWLITTPAKPLMTEQRPQVLRRLADTIYASPALGWPLVSRADDTAKAHVSLGEEEVRRNEQQAWAGRVRSMAWPAIAWSRSALADDEIQHDITGPDYTVEGGYLPADAAEMRESAFISNGQRAAFRRRAAKNLCAPPDRLSMLAPPRARAPTIDAIAAAFGQARNPVPEGGKSPDRAGLAPMLPGPVETTVSGQRPGVMLTQFEGLLLTSFMVPFDRDFSRFGRPAWRGPLTLRQVRAPRSSALPEITDLAIRRKTYVSMDEIHAPEILKTFKIVEGPAQLVRFERLPTIDTRSPHAVTIRVEHPDHGRLSADWDGRIRLIVTVPAGLNGPDPAAHIALARIGLLPSPAEMRRPRVELRVGDAVVVFTRMIWGETINYGQAPPFFSNDPKPTRLMIDFSIEGAARDTAQLAVAQALRDSSADTPVRITIRGTRASHAHSVDPLMDAAGSAMLETGCVNQLLPGPPNVLVFDLPHIPSRQRWLSVKTFTLVFGDPAYDRELGSPTGSAQAGIGDVPHVLAVDRAEYDPAATIHLAFWKRQKGVGTQIEKPAGSWVLIVQVEPTDGGPSRSLQIAATKAQPANPKFPGSRYVVDGCETYAIPLPALREPAGPKNPSADVPAQLRAGDRVRITVNNEAGDSEQLTLSVGIIALPVLPPPAATYGLATLQRLDAAVGTALFATAPLPQKIEFPDLLNDLVAGHVRRRGLFLWPFAGNGPAGADSDHAFGFLIKVDRTGGGQLPAAKADFQKSES
ncbi:hypothetical protein [Tardiphaga robiniae]|uniref:hypothetical protein n=1 Tax=Tardiphaga robiniae TaxID=943830 RepID=UPI001FE2592E|nr:hypothetical protein [Tardiphaga robiniae]